MNFRPDKTPVTAVFIFAALCFGSLYAVGTGSGEPSLRINAETGPQGSPAPSQTPDSAAWLCDARWRGGTHILVGTVTGVREPQSLAAEEREVIKNRLPRHEIVNTVRFRIEKTYKGEGKAAEIEFVNPRTAELPAADFKPGEKYLLYLRAETFSKNEILFYYAPPGGPTKTYAESAAAIAFLENNHRRKMISELLGELGPEVVSGGLVSGKAVNLPKPKYPDSLKEEKWGGRVDVWVLVDESGQVVKAKAVCAERAAAAEASEEAALRSKYRPTLLSGKPVKTTGVLVYNFVP